MKNTTLFLGLFLSLFNMSCTSKLNKSLISAEIITVDSLGKEVYKTAHLTDISVIRALGITIKDDIMVVITSNQDSLMSIFDFKAEKKLVNIGSIGRSSDEYISLSTEKQFEVRNGNICLWTCNADYKYMLLDITESIKENKIVIAESWKIGVDYLQSGGILMLPSDKRFVKFPVTPKDERNNIYSSPKYVYFSSDNKQENELKFFEDEDFTVDKTRFPNIIILAYSGMIRIKPDCTKIVDAYYYTDHINFLDIAKNNGFSVNYSKGLSVDDRLSLSIEELQEKSLYVYLDIAVTNSYVFALYSGKPDSPSPQNTTINSSVRIFDWNGNPISVVKTDRELLSIAIDEQTKKLYALDKDENIVYYNIEDII